VNYPLATLGIIVFATGMNFLRSLGTSIGVTGVRDLGIPTMDLLNPTMASKKATFAMS
jgi:hypothetical protein